MPPPLTEPPIQVKHHGQFHTGADADLWDEPPRRIYQQAAARTGLRALTRGKPAGELMYVFRVSRPGEPVMDNYHVMGSWLIGDPAGNVTAHRGHYIGKGGPWELANTIVPGSAHAVRSPVLTTYYRDHPEEHAQLTARHEAAMQRLLGPHEEAVRVGHLYAAIQAHDDPHFLPLLRAAVGDRATQLVLHDWLAERGFPHAAELRSKKWNKGTFTEAQLLHLLTKPFAASRRSFSGRTV